MKEIKWSLLKSECLKKTRGVSFEEILTSKLISVKKHASRKEQKIMLFSYKKYVWVVPFVEDKEHIFLKTLFSSRKYTKLYLEGKK
jgi:hypothetical protein